MRSSIIRLIVSLSLPFFGGGIGSFVTLPAITSWYEGLIKPFYTPPSWVFGPVWTMLYLLQGIAFFLFWQSKERKKGAKKDGFLLFITQLVANTFWSILFFGMRSPDLAFGCIIVLWIVILFTILVFYKVQKTASYLLIPYLLWVSFAAVLNFSIILLN